MTKKLEPTADRQNKTIYKEQLDLHFMAFQIVLRANTKKECEKFL